MRTGIGTYVIGIPESTVAPELNVTDSALVALRVLIGRHTNFVPIATVSWSGVGTTFPPDQYGRMRVRHREPGWDVGFFDRATLKADDIVEICGIEFTFDQAAESRRLDGATLDYRDGYFVIEDADA